jgi:hypothetical protein
MKWHIANVSHSLARSLFCAQSDKPSTANQNESNGEELNNEAA